MSGMECGCACDLDYEHPSVFDALATNARGSIMVGLVAGALATLEVAVVAGASYYVSSALLNARGGSCKLNLL